MKRTIIVVVCCIVATLSGHEVFNYAQEGFLRMGLNSVSAENFSRILWLISTAISLTALITMNRFLDSE